MVVHSPVCSIARPVALAPKKDHSIGHDMALGARDGWKKGARTGMDVASDVLHTAGGFAGMVGVIGSLKSVWAQSPVLTLIFTVPFLMAGWRLGSFLGRMTGYVVGPVAGAPIGAAVGAAHSAYLHMSGKEQPA